MLEGRLRWWEGPVSASKGAVMSEKSACLCQKGAFAGGRGAVSAWKSAVMGEKNVFRARRTSLQTEGAPYLLRMMQSYAKRALFVTEGAFAGGMGAVYA